MKTFYNDKLHTKVVKAIPWTKRVIIRLDGHIPTYSCFFVRIKY